MPTRCDLFGSMQARRRIPLPIGTRSELDDPFMATVVPGLPRPEMPPRGRDRQVAAIRLALGLVLASIGCRPEARTTVPEEPKALQSKDATSAERLEPQELEVVFIHGHSGHTPFPGLAPEQGAWMAWESMDVVPEDPEFALTPSGAMFADGARMSPDLLQHSGLRLAPEHVWLVGPSGPCRARVDSTALIYVDDFIGYAMSMFEVSGCDETQLGPIAVVGDAQQMQGVTWHPARSTQDFVAPYVSVPTLLRPLFERLLGQVDLQDAALGEGKLKARVTVVDSTVEPLIEVEYAVVWDEPERCKYECCDDDYYNGTKVEIGFLLPDGEVEALQFPDRHESADYWWLVGAFRRGEATIAVLLMNTWQVPYVLVRGPGAWPVASPGTSVWMGAVYDEDQIEHGFGSPCDGP